MPNVVKISEIASAATSAEITSAARIEVTVGIGGTPTTKYLDGEVLKEVIRDEFGGSFLVQGTGITITHNDGANTLTIAANIGTDIQAYSANLDALAADPLTATTASSTYLTIASAASTYQPLDADLTAIAALSSADGNFIVGSATGWVAESGATARTSLGAYGAGDSPTFAGVTVTGAGGVNFDAPTHYLSRSGTANVYYSSGFHIIDGTAGNIAIFTVSNKATALYGDLTVATSITVASDLTLASGSITSASGAISFGNENLSTTGLVTAGGGLLVDGGSFAAGRFYKSSTQGLAVGAITGSVYDFALFTPSGSTAVFRVPTGTNTAAFEGNITTTGTLASGAGTFTGATNDGSSLLRSIQSGTGRALEVNRSAATATRPVATFANTNAAGGTQSVVLIQQADVGEYALGINSDGSLTAFNFSVKSDGTLASGNATVTDINVSVAGLAAPRVTSSDGLGDAVLRFYSGAAYKGGVGWDQGLDVIGIYNSIDSASPKIRVSSTVDIVANTTVTGTLGVTGNTVLGSTSVTADGTLHVHKATAGAVAASSVANTLVVENSSTAGISILSPAANSGFLVFGSPTSNLRGYIQYSHSTDVMSHYSTGAIQIVPAGSTAAYFDTSGNMILGGGTATSSNAQFYATKTYSAASGTDIGAYFNFSQGVATTGGLRGIQSNATGSHTSGTVALLTAGQFSSFASGAGGTTTAIRTIAIGTWGASNATATVGTAIGLYIPAATKTGTVTAAWPIYSESTDPSYLAGSLRIGTTSATSHATEVFRAVRSSGSSARVANFHVEDSAASFIQFSNSTTGTSITDGLIVGIDSAENAQLWNYESAAMLFGTANTERFRVASNAYALGIGTTDVEAWSASYGAIEFGRSALFGAVSGEQIALASNAYYAGGYAYKASSTMSALFNVNAGGFEFYTAPSGTADAALTWSEKMRLTNGGMLLVGDTANANMTVGLTINAGGNDDEHFAIKNSDVTHALTSDAETDTFFSISKLSNTIGGTTIRSIAEDGATSSAFRVISLGGTADTTKSTSGLGLIDLIAYEHNGAGAYANVTADGNVLSVRARVGGGTNTLFLLDEDGDTWQTGSLTTGAPSGGTAAPWKLGTVSATSPTSPDRTIEVDINGTIYYIHAKTTND